MRNDLNVYVITKAEYTKGCNHVNTGISVHLAASLTEDVFCFFKLLNAFSLPCRWSHCCVCNIFCNSRDLKGETNQQSNH